MYIVINKILTFPIGCFRDTMHIMYKVPQGLNLTL